MPKPAFVDPFEKPKGKAAFVDPFSGASQEQLRSAKPSTTAELPPGVDTPIVPFLQRLAKGEGLPIVGETAGGLAAARRSTPLGAAASALGGSGMEAMRQLIQQQQGMEEAPKTSLEAAKRIGGAGVKGAVGEYGGRKVFGLLSKLAAPYRKSLTEEGKTAIELVRGRGIVTPGEATSSRSLDILENIAEGSIFGGGRMAATKKATKDIITNTIDDFVAHIGPQTDRKILRTLLGDTIAKGKKTFEQVAEGWYKGLDRLAPSSTETIVERVPTSILDASGNPIYKAVSKQVQKGSVDIRGVKKMASGMKAFTETAKLGEGAKDFAKIIAKGDNLTFSEAHAFRTSLYEAADTPGLIGTTTSAELKKLASSVENSMERAARKEGGNAWEQFREISANYKTGSARFRNDLVTKLAKKDADLIVDTLLSTKEPINIEQVKNILLTTDKSVWPKVQNAFAGKIILDAKDPITNQLSAKKALEALSGFDRSGALKEFFPKNEIALIKKSLGGLHAIQEKGAEGTGRMAIQLMQAGAIVGAATGGVSFILTGDIGVGAGAGLTGGGLVILGGPAMLGRAFTNPRIAKFLSEGYTLGPGIREAAKFLARLETHAKAEGFKTMTYDQFQKMQSQKEQPSFFKRLSNLPMDIAPQASRARGLSEALGQRPKIRP